MGRDDPAKPYYQIVREVISANVANGNLPAGMRLLTSAPGRFNPIGSVIAVYFLVTGITGPSIVGISTFVQDLFYGGALVVAVVLSQVVRGRQERVS